MGKIPEWTICSAQDPLPELWKHGSNVTYIIEFIDFLPAFFKTNSSAWGLPFMPVELFAKILLFFTKIQPTEGLGNVLPNFFFANEWANNKYLWWMFDT